MSNHVQEQRPFSEVTRNRLSDAINEAYKIRLVLITPTRGGSSVADFPPYEGAQEKLSDLVGFPINGDEFLYEIAVRMENTVSL